MSDLSKAEAAILTAWRNVETYGLTFGKACYDWQHAYATRGGVGAKGQGFVPMLERLKIPVSTAYFWINRYKQSLELKEATAKPKPAPTEVCPPVRVAVQTVMHEYRAISYSRPDFQYRLRKEPPVPRPPALPDPPAPEGVSGRARHTYAYFERLLNDALNLADRSHNFPLEAGVKKLRECADQLEVLARQRQGEQEKKVQALGLQVGAR